jgi:hypothetical protein
MTTYKFRCPHGSTTLRASNAKSLQDKIVTHNMTAHCPRPIIMCGAGPASPNTHQPVEPITARRYAGLSGRGI